VLGCAPRLLAIAVACRASPTSIRTSLIIISRGN